MIGKMMQYLPAVFTCFLLSVFIFFSSFASADPEKTGLHSINAEELVRGERLFYGLVYRGDKSVNCAACHNTRYNDSDTINWNPDAVEIARKYSGLQVSDLERVLLKPAGQMLPLVHKNFDLSTEDIFLIKHYLDTLDKRGLVQPKPVINRLIVFIFLLLVNLFFITDLFVLKKIRFKWIHLIIILGTGFFLTRIMVEDAIAIGRSENFAPDQPIKFSHEVHAGQNQTECLYCHSQAEYSKSAGIPGVNVCMNCHLIVRNGTNTGAWEINKVLTAWENNFPVQWIRIHNNPDHVFFSHAQHVSIGGAECSECHGKIESMDRVRQVSDLSMGWCITCHREREVAFHSNDFYSGYEELAKKIKRGDLNKISVEKVGGTECMKCHY